MAKEGKEKKLQVKIQPKTNKVSVPGLITEEITSKAHILRLLARSNKNRVTAETAMNERISVVLKREVDEIAMVYRKGRQFRHADNSHRSAKLVATE